MALVLSEENDVQGFVIARVVRDEWEIENIAVAGAARRRGLGTRLLSELLDMARAQRRQGDLSGGPRIEPRSAGALRKVGIPGKRAPPALLPGA